MVAMVLDWSPLRKLIAECSDILVLTHMRPDGDAVGSCVALALLLQEMGCRVKIGLDGPCPANLQFLQPQDLISSISELVVAEVSGIVVVDTGTWNQVGTAAPILRTPGRKIVVIDHHRTQDDLGGDRILDVTAEAAAVLVDRFYAAVERVPSPDAATALFVGLASDTGWFRHPNCVSTSFEMAARLMQAGANPSAIHEKLYSGESLARQRVKGHILSTMKVLADGRVGLFKVLQSDLARMGANAEEALGGMVDLPRQVAGVRVAVALYEHSDGGTRASLRSDGTVDVATICATHGGGGHRPAAGCTLSVSPDRAEEILMADLVSVLDPDARVTR
jgi:phosphoesterase RecJ-like protein